MKNPLSNLFSKIRVALSHRNVAEGIDDYALTQIVATLETAEENRPESLWSLIRLLLDDPNQRDEFIIDPIIVPVTAKQERQFTQFREQAQRVTQLSCIEDEDMCPQCYASASDRIYSAKNIIFGCATDNILTELRTFRISCTTSDAVTAFIPWLSGTIYTLALTFGPAITDMSVISCLLVVQELCTDIRSFTLTLDNSNYAQPRDGVMDVLLGTISAMRKLRDVFLPADIITDRILDALAVLPDLNALAVTPATSHVVINTIYMRPIIFSASRDAILNFEPELDALSDLPDICSLPPVPDIVEHEPSIATSRFHNLQNLRISARSWMEVLTILRVINPNLRHLVIFLPADTVEQSPQERAEALGNILALYPDAEIQLV